MHNDLNRFVLKSSLPVMFGYVPMGMAFGILFSELGYHWLYATLMAVMIFAGAAQFLAVGLLANGASLFEMAVAIFLLNSRHIFYGLSVMSRLETRGAKKAYQIFGLTDETFSLLTSLQVPSGFDKAEFQFRLTLVNQSYWVLGCTLGALLGVSFSFPTEGIDFVLPALFVVLTIEQFKSVQRWTPFVLAAGIGLISIFWISREHMLLISIVLCLSVLLMMQSSEEKWGMSVPSGKSGGES